MIHSYSRRVLIHNGKILRVSLPLRWCTAVEWRVGDALVIEGNEQTATLTLKRQVKPQRRRFTK